MWRWHREARVCSEALKQCSLHSVLFYCLHIAPIRDLLTSPDFPHRVTKEASVIHDSVMESTLTSLLEADSLPDLSARQAHLKVSNGGMGMTSMFDQRHHAFLAPWADSLRTLLNETSPLVQELRLVTDLLSQTSSAKALRDCHQFLCGVLGETLIQNLSELHQMPLKLQSRLGAELDQLRLDDLIRGETIKQRLASCRYLVKSLCLDSGNANGAASFLEC